jgi:hypothetical protein
MWTNDHNIPRSITPINSSTSVDILSSSPVDHVDVSENTEIPADDNEQRLEQGDVTDNEVEWNWEEQDEAVAVIEERKVVTVTRPKIDDNIDGLDIKNQKLAKMPDEAEDFFSDFGMTPTFNAATVVNSEVFETSEVEETSVVARLQMSIVGDVENEGWGEDENWDEHENNHGSL